MGQRLEGRRAIVTGGGSGMGRASAIAFAREGASVLLVDLSGAAAEETAQIIVDAGGKAIAVVADVTDESAVAAYTQRCVDELGGLDILFANAGIYGPMDPPSELSVETFQAILNVNLMGQFLAIKYASPPMLAQKHGAIVCNASMSGMRANAGGIPYSVSKTGVISMMQVCSYMFGERNVRVNAVCPGLIVTGLTAGLFQSPFGDKLAQYNALKRAASADEVAQTVLFLASDEASYITGQAIAVDAGTTTSIPFMVEGLGGIADQL